MNRNVESHFSTLPQVDIQRSIFDRSSTHKTSFNAGELIPIYIDEVLPGDSVKMTTSKVVRAQTMLTPILDNMYLDVYWYFIPLRLVYEHTKELFGENSNSAWVSPVQYQLPTISSPLDDKGDPTNFAVGTIADYMGLQTYNNLPDPDNPGQYLKVPVVWSADAKNAPIATPLRAYARVCDEWFRDQNLTDPLNIPYGDSNQTGSNGDDYINDVANGGKPFKVAKYHDYFTSMLPSAQKAAGPVTIPMSSTLPSFTIPGQTIPSQFYQVGTRDIMSTGWTRNLDPDKEIMTDPFRVGNDMIGIAFKSSSSADVNGLITSSSNYSKGSSNVTETPVYVDPDDPDSAIDHRELSDFPSGYRYPVNLWSYQPDLNIPDIVIPDMSTTDSVITVNDLRLAFQLQKFYEKMARGGSRYIEVLKAHFGVSSPDARLQRTEYLGGNRIPITIHEVTNNAQSEQDFLGDLGAKSRTTDVHEDFEHSFVEHGYLLGCACVRYSHSYPQGQERFWTRKKMEDFYWPSFANLGEQGCPVSTLYATTETLDSDEIFGFQECWADYRYKPDRVSAEMRPGVDNTLSSWHLSDYYTEKPVLSDEWIREDKTNVDRVLAVTSELSNQFFGDFYFKSIWTRPMPMYSIPGLIDHN